MAISLLSPSSSSLPFSSLFMWRFCATSNLLHHQHLWTKAQMPLIAHHSSLQCHKIHSAHSAQLTNELQLIRKRYFHFNDKDAIAKAIIHYNTHTHTMFILRTHFIWTIHRQTHESMNKSTLSRSKVAVVRVCVVVYLEHCTNIIIKHYKHYSIRLSPWLYYRHLQTAQNKRCLLGDYFFI